MTSNKKQLSHPIIFFAVLISTVLLILIFSIINLPRIMTPRKYTEYVSRYAAEYQLEESLVYAVIKSESSFRPAALSKAGAIGLMQITPDTFYWAQQRMGITKQLDASKLYDVQTNIRFGCYILSLFRLEFRSDKTALAAYNAGRGRVNEWLSKSEYSDDGLTLKEIPYPETAKYVEKVIYTQKLYDKIYNKPK